MLWLHLELHLTKMFVWLSCMNSKHVWNGLIQISWHETRDKSWDQVDVVQSWSVFDVSSETILADMISLSSFW